MSSRVRQTQSNGRAPAALPTLNPGVCARLREHYAVYQTAEQTVKAAMAVALEGIGLDPTVPWRIDLQTGAIRAPEATLVADPAAATA